MSCHQVSKNLVSAPAKKQLTTNSVNYKSIRSKMESTDFIENVHMTLTAQKAGEKRQIIFDKVCIHCRRRLNGATFDTSPDASMCSYPCPDIVQTIQGQRSHNQFKCFPDLTSILPNQFQPDARLNSFKKFRFSELVKCHHGWGKQLPFFLVSSQGFYYLLLGLLLLLLFPTTTMSNPLPSTSGESSRSSSGQTNDPAGSTSPHHRHGQRHEREQKWINPCRIPPSLPTFSSSDNELIQTQPDQDIFHNIIVQANKAETQALEFFKDFYREAFGGDPEESDRYERLTYDFLTDVMDQVNNQLIDEHFSTLQVDETIRLMYQGLQKFAVGLEAIVLDQACYGGSFYHHFNEAEFQLKYVLCELQIAMLEKNISHNDITREIMATEYRDLADKTTRYIRDWTIFRDYVKTLRYVRHAFQYFRNRVISSGETPNPVQETN